MDKKQRKGLLIVLFIILLGMTACKSKSNTEKEPAITPTPVSTETAAPTPTAKPEEAKEEEQEEANTEETKTVINTEDAIKRILSIIGERGYYVELLNDNLTVGKEIYYEFQISDSSEVIAPNVLMDKVTGKLLCYNADGSTSDFTEHPLYPAGSNTASNSAFTKEDALEKLSGLSAKTLRLPKDLTNYNLSFDDWTTKVDDKLDSYGISVYEDKGDRMNLMGNYYITVDGSKIFLYDSVEDAFIEIKE